METVLEETAARRFMEKVRITESCWIWTGCAHGNKQRPDLKYGYFHFLNRTWKAHRVSYVLFVGQITLGMCVLHECDNTLCVNPQHLFLGTQLDNVRDCKAKGRRRYSNGADHWAKHNGDQMRESAKRYFAENPGVHAGERNSRAIFTVDQINEIRRRYAQGGILQRELAAEFNTCQARISAIVTRKQWKSI